MALKLGIQTYQILANDDEVCISNLSSTLLAVLSADVSLKISWKYPKIVSSEDHGKHYFGNEWTLVEWNSLKEFLSLNIDYYFTKKKVEKLDH